MDCKASMMSAAKIPQIVMLRELAITVNDYSSCRAASSKQSLADEST